MTSFDGILLGLEVAAQPINLVYCFFGVFLGTLIGVLPGIGPATTMALLLPITINAPPESGIILLAGLYYGSMYGGSTTSILVNVPGEAASVVTTLDGYQMARTGRAGPALAIAAIGSFIAGTVSVVALSFIAVPLARAAVYLSPADYVGLMVLGLVMVGVISSGSISKAILTTCFGVVLGLVGIDSMSGAPRFTFDIPQLIEGIDVITLVVGLFGVSEVLQNLEQAAPRSLVAKTVGRILPSREEWKRSRAPIARGSILGFVLGLLPGGGAVLAAFASYGLEKRISARPEEFGKGAVEGLAGPESANNAAATAAFIPLLTLGIPPNVVLGILLGALMIQGIAPGPLMMVQNPDVFWGTVASMYVGNIMLLILNLPLIGMWIQILRIPYGVMFPLILVFCVIGVYGTTGSTFHLGLMIGFGVIGYVLRRCGYDLAPLVLGFVLGPLLEANMRRSLTASDGSWSFLFSSYVGGACLVVSVVLIVSAMMPAVRKRREMLGNADD
ncbi:MAG TPA: tripartite tricarboxylate transporter permease [Rhizobiaceae bacterium]|nr:tripartite tricarboxylate transporter permease [Rhizobiaceae bacterium]